MMCLAAESTRDPVAVPMLGKSEKDIYRVYLYRSSFGVGNKDT